MHKTKEQLLQKKQTFFTRTRSAIFVVVFYVVYLLLLYFSNGNWFAPIKNILSAQFVLSFFNVLMCVPIIVFVANEISNLCFPGHKAIFIYTACAIFVLTMTISLFLLLMRYDFMPAPQISFRGKEIDHFVFFLIIALAGIIFFALLSTLVWVIMSRHIVYVGKRVRLWFPLLIFILNTFFVGFIYTTIIHSWTTYLFLMITSVLCDVFAYIGGSNFGKHKLAPKTSPKKTWEGVLFGAGVTLVVVCAIVSIFYFVPNAENMAHSLYCYLGCQVGKYSDFHGTLINLQPYFWAIYIFVTIFLMFISVTGDLFFSFIKRKFNIKDFSNLIPGHGGILDRLDALIFIFTAYFLITVVIQLIMALGFQQVDGLKYLWTGNSDIPPNFVL